MAHTYTLAWGGILIDHCKLTLTAEDVVKNDIVYLSTLKIYELVWVFTCQQSAVTMHFQSIDGYYVIGRIVNLGIKAGNKALQYHASTLRKNPRRLMLIDRNISKKYSVLEYLEKAELVWFKIAWLFTCQQSAVTVHFQSIDGYWLLCNRWNR